VPALGHMTSQELLPPGTQLRLIYVKIDIEGSLAASIAWSSGGKSSLY
jgi:hypothetical protein